MPVNGEDRGGIEYRVAASQTSHSTDISPKNRQGGPTTVSGMFPMSPGGSETPPCTPQTPGRRFERVCLMFPAGWGVGPPYARYLTRVQGWKQGKPVQEKRPSSEHKPFVRYGTLLTLNPPTPCYRYTSTTALPSPSNRSIFPDRPSPWY